MALDSDAARSSVAAEFELAAAWRLHPSVAVRPEPFGALLYHYGTRRLTFVKDSTLLQVLLELDASPSAEAALRASGVTVNDLARYAAALQRLAATDMLVREARGALE
jgi:mycofactocin biosynthesis protein MftB